MKFITFVLFVSLFVLSLTEEDFFRANCHEVINTNKACPQFIWDYPKCVPWDTTKCKLRRSKKKALLPQLRLLCKQKAKLINY